MRLTLKTEYTKVCVNSQNLLSYGVRIKILVITEPFEC